jgi:hypothetical protein
METDQMTGQSKHPIWRAVAEEMVQNGIEFGQTWPVDYFEGKLKCHRTDKRFVWEMIDLRHYIEVETGQYIGSSDNGRTYSVPPAFGHEDIASRFDHRVRRFAVRAVNMRSATLMNAKAILTSSERATMEKNLEIASTRLVLLARSTSIAATVKKHAPRLLK